MQHYTQNTLSELLKHKDHTVQRHAKGIEARLHALELEQLDYVGNRRETRCPYCKTIVTTSDYLAYGGCKSCFEFYNK